MEYVNRAQFGSLTAVELLLQQPNIKVNLQNKLELDTPLHKAVQYKDDPSVALEIGNFWKSTLKFLTTNKINKIWFHLIVKLLIKHGADPT